MSPLPEKRETPVLIGQYDSPFVRRVAIAMQRYGVAYEHVPWSVWADSDAIAHYNPLRRVPTLVLADDTVLVESFAILEYLDECAGSERALLPSHGPVRRAGLRIAALATGVADKSVSLLYEYVLRKSPVQSQIWADRCAAQITHTIALLEAERSARNTPFWFGDALTHADIAVTCALTFTREAHPKLAAARLGPGLIAHIERCEALAVFQRIRQPLVVAL
jgi:glutathione S-transferase